MNPGNLAKIVRVNSLLWLAAMLLPAAFYLALGEARFPWPGLIPFMLFGPMLASNRFIRLAAGRPAAGTEPPAATPKI